MNLPLTPLIAQSLASAPRGALRAWSLAVSFLGDCVVPRGGSVNMTTIAGVLGAYGIDAGAVRTALSRLAADGWVTRRRIGRNSFYTLTPLALGQSQAASGRIYARTPPQQPCGWQLVNLTGMADADRRRLREALLRQGAGQFDVHTLILPADMPLPAVGPGFVLRLPALPELEARTLVARCFDLAALGRSYANFRANHLPVAEALAGRGTTVDGLEAVALRVLIVHRFRRIALRDPGLPQACLAADWPGLAARELLHRLRADLNPAAEAWLDRHLTGP
jgi:phenylacetic acid degradation operon negative regulatory protein